MSEILNDDHQVQIEQIMIELRTELEKRRQAGGFYELPPALEAMLQQQVPGGLLPDYLQQMLQYWEVGPGLPVSHRRLFSGFIFAGIKKLVRFLIGWYIEPALERQRLFNLCMLRCLAELVSARRAEMEERRNEN